jgi:hypothetical protein
MRAVTISDPDHPAIATIRALCVDAEVVDAVRARVGASD